MLLELSGNSVHLLHQKAAWMPDTGTIALADIHLGKARHFRSEGLPLPLPAQDPDYLRLSDLLKQWQARRVLFLGDLFHSKRNHDWERFSEWITSFPQTDWMLMKGNHDIIDPALFREIGIAVCNDLQEQGLIYSHEPLCSVPSDHVNVCGHLHPGILLEASARQRLRLPCFFQRKAHFILPAFGSLTGLAIMERKRGDHAYGILPDEVRQLF